MVLSVLFGGDILISTTEVFDPGTNSWKTLSPLPTQRVSAGCIAIGNLIYVIGGWEEDTRTSVKAVQANYYLSPSMEKVPIFSDRKKLIPKMYPKSVLCCNRYADVFSIKKSVANVG